MLSRTALLFLLVTCFVALSSPRAAAQPRMVQPESLPQGFILIVSDPSGIATADSPIYLASSHNGWNPGDAGQRLTPRSDRRWQIVLPKPTLDSRIAFKFTRGSWESVEVAADGKDVENRTLLLIDASGLADGEKPVIELTIAAWKPAAAPAEQYPAIKATGTVRRVEVTGGGLPLTRDLLVWLPPGYDAPENAQRRYPVLYLQDGQNVFEQPPGVPGEWGADETATRLITEGVIEPIIIVAIPNARAGRNAEYLPAAAINGVTPRADAYVDFLVREVVPRVERAFRVKPGHENTAIGGSSLGAVVSLYAATRHPEVFGKVLAESPALLRSRGDAIMPLFEAAPVWPARLYIGMGEREVIDEIDAARLAKDARDLDALAARKGLADADRLLVLESDGEHNEPAWARRLPEALKFLFSSGPR